MSGGGGGPSNTTSTVTQNSIPAYAEPYVTDMLGRGQALTSSDYQPYQGQQVAGFNNTQNQAFGQLNNMGVPSQTGDASALAGAAGLGALSAGNYQSANTNNQYRNGVQNFTGANVNQYMSPYMQGVVENQKLGAIEDYARNLPQLGAAATQVGGRGGTRDALMQSEAMRNLQGQLQGIQAAGSQAGFQNAQQQFNTQQQTNMQNAANRAQYGLGSQTLNENSRQFGANMGMQGIQQALAASGQLGQLGQNQYTQQMGINQAQLAAGNQQQALQQQQLTSQYQDFLNSQNYPYKQLGFMSDLIHGTGATTQSGSTVYGAAPNTAGQIAGLAGGLGSLFMK